MKEINPDETSRAEACRLWMNAPMPMVTLFKTLNVTNLARTSKRKGLKFNMPMCWCIGTSALVQYDIDGAVGMYSGIFNNPFIIWGRYRRHLWTDGICGNGLLRSRSSSTTPRWTAPTPRNFWTCCRQKSMAAFAYSIDKHNEISGTVLCKRNYFPDF